MLSRPEWCPGPHAHGNGRQLSGVRHQGAGEQRHAQAIGREADEQRRIGGQQQHCGWLQRRPAGDTGQI